MVYEKLASLKSFLIWVVNLHSFNESASQNEHIFLLNNAFSDQATQLFGA